MRSVLPSQSFFGGDPPPKRRIKKSLKGFFYFQIFGLAFFRMTSC
jgi:hypothetical protein